MQQCVISLIYMDINKSYYTDAKIQDYVNMHNMQHATKKLPENDDTLAKSVFVVI